MNSLFHKLITLLLKATEVFACLHRWYFCSKGLEQLRWAETELHAVGRPPKGTSAQRLSVKVGGFFVQTLRLNVNSRKRVTREILSCAVIWNLFLGFLVNPISISLYNVFLECYLSVELLVTLIFRETRGFCFVFYL